MLNKIKHPKKPFTTIKALREHSSLTYEWFVTNFHDFDKKNYEVVNIKGYEVIAHKEDLIEVRYQQKGNIKLPKCYTKKTGVVKILQVDGELYTSDSPLISKAKDTGNYVLKDKAFSTPNGYYESDKDLLFCSREMFYYHESLGVFCEDTQSMEYKPATYRSNDKYYKYPEMSTPTERWRHALYTNESIFPTINERRIGIEYEFGNSFDMFKDFLASDFKYYWDSVRDGSLDSISQGIEFVSVPFKIDELHKAREFLEFAKKQGATIPRSCGFHIHIGAKDLHFMDISNLISLCTKIEGEMFTLGDATRSKNTYCKSLDEKFKGFTEIKVPKDKNAVGEKLYTDQRGNFYDRHQQSKYVDAQGHRGVRYYWVNIDRFFYKREQPEQKTVEFRNHCATWNADDFFNYTLLCYYIVEYAKNHSKDTCLNSTLFDIARTSHIKHRKQLKNYLNQKLN